MNIAYFGSPEISAVLLEEIIKDSSHGCTVSLVITQPDRPVGKRLEIQPTPVKKIARAYNIPFFDKTLVESQNELVGLLDKYHIELCVVFAYGELIKTEILEKPKHGFWNIHPSLLPSYRGPTPAAYALMNGDKMTGVSLIKLIQKMDAGPILSQSITDIEPSEMRNELEQRLTLMGSDLLIENLKKLNENIEIELKPQDETKATYTRLLKKQHGFIHITLLQDALYNTEIKIGDLPDILKVYLLTYKNTKVDDSVNSSSKMIYDFYRAISPWPGLWTKVQTTNGEKRLQINRMSIIENKLTISKVKLEGKNETDFETFNKSYNIFE